MRCLRAALRHCAKSCRVPSVPAERTVTCPQCNAPKITKAAKNNRLSCASCGHKFLSPAPPLEEETQVTTVARPPKGKATTRTSGATVVTASGTTIRKNAKVRQAKEAPAVEPEKQEKPEKEDPYKPPAHQERSKIAGHRGGIAYYKRFRKAKAESK